MAEDGDDGKSSQPLLGVVLCCTALPTEQRSELACRAEQMGAVHRLDLTSDVTHLLVGDPNTPKYRYVARERPDVKILTTEWVEALRQLWIQDADINLQELEENHRLPVFAGLRICLTGFDDVAERQRLQQFIQANGAEYHANLTKSVTHLLAHKTEGEKYRYASLWGLKIVSLEWLVDSLDRGMILDEELYNPLTPQQERGRNAWVRTLASEKSLGKREHLPEQSADDGANRPVSRRKLRRTASSKLQSQNSDIWGDIVGGGSGRDATKTGAWEGGTSDDRQIRKALLPAPEAEPESRLAHRPDRSIPPVQNESDNAKAGELSKHRELNNPGLFIDKRFYLYGFDDKKTNILRNHILVQDGEVLTSSFDFLRAIPEGQWHRAYVVVPHNLEEDFDRLTICSTAFSGVDLLHFSKVVKLMGAKYDEFLTPGASVLVCNAPLQNKEKVRHATEWGVPGVDSRWLWDSINQGRQLPFGSYLLSASKDAENSSTLPPRQRTSHKNSANDARRSKSDISGLKDATSEGRSLGFEIAGDGLMLRDNAENEAVAPPSKATSHDRSPPLQTLEPRVNSSKRPSSANKAPDVVDYPQRNRPASVGASEDLNAAIASLLAQKQSASSAQGASSIGPTTNAPSKGGKPPPRLLGKASSNLSGRSTGLSLRADSMEYANLNALTDQPPEPSQRVIYADPEAREHRERVVRKMGGKVENTGPKKVRSIGVAKDLGGVGSRTRQKTNVGV